MSTTGNALSSAPATPDPRENGPDMTPIERTPAVAEQIQYAVDTDIIANCIELVVRGGQTPPPAVPIWDTTRAALITFGKIRPESVDTFADRFGAA